MCNLIIGSFEIIFVSVHQLMDVASIPCNEKIVTYMSSKKTVNLGTTLRLLLQEAGQDFGVLLLFQHSHTLWNKAN